MVLRVLAVTLARPAARVASLMCNPNVHRSPFVISQNFPRCFASETTPKQAWDDGEVAELYANVFMQAAPAWERMIDAVRRNSSVPPESVLDLASGPGQPAAMFAETFPSAQIRSTDFAPDMVSQARERMAKLGLKNVTCEVGDMQALTDVASDSVDVCTVSFGYMFAPDLPKALSETNRVLRKGGIMVATVWLDMPLIPMLGKVMTDVLGAKPPPPPNHPMSLSERAALDGPLAAAGLKIVDDEEGSIRIDLGNDPDVSWRLGTIPMLQKLKELQTSGAHGDVMATARSTFERETAGWMDPETKKIVTPPAKYRLVVVRKE